MAPFLTLALLLVPADWPHLRGPAYDGVSAAPDLADSWPGEGPPRLWSVALGQGHSGFIVGGGRVYTQRQTLGGQFVLCLDPDSGQTLWEARVDWAWQPRGAYPGPYATPTYADGRVYYATPAGQVGCLNANDGSSGWTLNLRTQFAGKGYGFGCAASPLVEDGRVILPAGGPQAGMVALAGDDGRVLWRSGADPASYCPAYPLTFRGRRCVVGYLQNAFVLVEMATGKELLRQPLSSGYDEHSAWPLYREPHLLFLAPFRAPATCYRLDGDDRLRAVPHWTNPEFANDVVSSVLYRDHVYGFDIRQQQSSMHRPSRGSLKCLDWATGKTTWSTPVGHAGLVVGDDKLYLLTDTGHLVLARADPTAYRELGRVRLFEDATCWTPPTLWRGRLFVRSPSQGLCLWVGETRQQPGHAVPLTPPRSWRLEPGWLLTRERDYPNDAPTRTEMTTWFLAGLVLLPLALLLRPVAGWCLVFALGLLGPNLGSVWWGECLWTWPVSLYAAFHVTVRVCVRATEQQSSGWLARLALAGLVLVSYLYFEACRAVGMFVAWAFLSGYPAALLWTWLAVRAERRPWLAGFWSLLGYAAFFWSAQAVLLWKAG